MWNSKNIWFNCPACDDKLVVSREAGGSRTDCPVCGRNIPVPERSTEWPAWLPKAAVYASMLLLLAAGIGVGWWRAFGREPTVNADLVAPVIATTADAAAETVPGEKPLTDGEAARMDLHRELLRDHAALQGRYQKMLQWMIENYRGKYPLPERLVSRLRIAPLTETGEVSPDLTELLRLSDEEKATVLDAMKYVRTALAQVERERAMVTEQTETRITYEVPVFPEVGGPLKEDLFLALETTLGAPRFDRMVNVAGEALREQMYYFGEASRTLSFEVIMPPEPGAFEPYVLIRDGWMFPDGESVRLTKVQETAIVELPDAYRAYADWMPEEISRYTVQ